MSTKRQPSGTVDGQGADVALDASETDAESFVPLPRLAFQILLALARGESHGYAIAKEVERNTDGRTKPSTGSLYLSMDKLHSQALIEEAAGPPPRGCRRRCPAPLLPYHHFGAARGARRNGTDAAPGQPRPRARLAGGRHSSRNRRRSRSRRLRR